jgi:diacylglycerol kinase (ATP)
MPHQWHEGNLPVSAKCSHCDKTCGSVLRLQDWRCLWCKITVHTACRPNIDVRCPLGPVKVSVIPPTCLHSIGIDDSWDVVKPQGSFSPLLVFVNSKSGDNQGVKFLRRFKQLLNPAQVFDLISTGPEMGLRLFKHFDPFRILICSGDGSIGWVLAEIDRLNMHVSIVFALAHKIMEVIHHFIYFHNTNFIGIVLHQSYIQSIEAMSNSCIATRYW